MTSIWPKQLSVDKNVVKILSSSTYDNFPGAIREMVSNAYDADATRVEITIDLTSDYIEISDNGNGMTPSNFDVYLKIAAQQRERKLSPVFNRKRIGQFGIGFLAIFPFGRTINISSTARRSDIRFEANIQSQLYFSNDEKSLDISEIPVAGFEEKHSKYLKQHWTTIRISNLTDITKGYFKSNDMKIPHSRSTIKTWDAMDRLIWGLEEDLPLDYPENSPLFGMFSNFDQTGLRVWVNSKELLRNTPGKHVLERSEWSYGDIQCEYAILTDWNAIQPEEERFFKIRLRNVGIGRRDKFDFGLGKVHSRGKWLTGEIQIIQGLDNLLSIDRNRFVDHPDYEQFREFFRKRLGFQAAYLEDVDTSKKMIKKQFSDSRLAEVGSKKEIVSRNLEKLKSKGFKIETYKQENMEHDQLAPVIIDVDTKTVKVIDNHSLFQDQISIKSEITPLVYSSWNIDSSKYPAIRRNEEDIIEVNTLYPLFKSKTYGEVFKRILILFLLESEINDQSKELFSKFSNELLLEFEDII